MRPSCWRIVSFFPARFGDPSISAHRRSPSKPCSVIRQESNCSPAIDLTGYRQISATLPTTLIVSASLCQRTLGAQASSRASVLVVGAEDVPTARGFLHFAETAHLLDDRIHVDREVGGLADAAILERVRARTPRLIQLDEGCSQDRRRGGRCSPCSGRSCARGSPPVSCAASAPSAAWPSPPSACWRLCRRWPRARAVSWSWKMREAWGVLCGFE